MASQVGRSAQRSLSWITGVLDWRAEELSEHIAGSAKLKLLVGAPGTTLEQVGRFFNATADFYRQKPWCRITDDCVIEVRCNKNGRSLSLDFSRIEDF